MHQPLFSRPLSTEERGQLRAGLRSDDAFTLRRCQILLASVQGQSPRVIARNLGCSKGTARNAINAFHAQGLACLDQKSSRPHSARPFLTENYAAALEDLRHHSPRLAGKKTSLWTLDLLAEVCYAYGWTPRVLTGEAIRKALLRLDISWQRAKHWITSPDPAYARKKTRTAIFAEVRQISGIFQVLREAAVSSHILTGLATARFPGECWRNHGKQGYHGCPKLHCRGLQAIVQQRLPF